jgi:hypothetical protein
MKKQSIKDRIAEELSNIEAAIKKIKRKRKKDPESLCQLYVAQAALEWLLSPPLANAPTEFVLAGKVRMA